MRLHLTVLLLAMFSLAFLGCSRSPKSGKGFTLPEGDVEAGKNAFVTLQCTACHTVSGVEKVVGDDGKAEMSVALGGEVARIATYGELVTSIINPSHRVAPAYQVEEIAENGESKMRNYNDVLTVQQLCDLVAFLQSKYELRKYEPTHYPDYGPYM